MKPLRIVIYSLFSLLLLTSNAKAQGIPVYDAAGFVQLIAQVDQMAQDYAKQIEQLDEAVQQTAALTGTRNMGSFANDALEAELRRYLPTTWENTIDMINAGGLSNSALGTQGIFNDLYTAYNPISGANFVGSDPTGPIASAVDRRTNTTFVAMAASEQAYNNITNRIGTYEGLLSELNNTTDLKASVDLQSRISVENGLIMNELMRMNAIAMQQRAAYDNEEITSYRRASDASRYDADDAATIFELK